MERRLRATVPPFHLACCYPDTGRWIIYLMSRRSSFETGEKHTSSADFAYTAEAS